MVLRINNTIKIHNYQHNSTKKQSYNQNIKHTDYNSIFYILNQFQEWHNFKPSNYPNALNFVTFVPNLEISLEPTVGFTETIAVSFIK